jgi:hypothetical protein
MNIHPQPVFETLLLGLPTTEVFFGLTACHNAEPEKVHGACRSITSKRGVSLHCMTMCTSDRKDRVWVYRGKGTKYLQDTFEINEPTREKFLRVMLERAALTLSGLSLSQHHRR